MVVRRREAGLPVEIANLRRKAGGVMVPATDGWRREAGAWVRVWPTSPASNLQIIRVTPPSRFILSGLSNGAVLPQTGGPILAGDVVVAFMYAEAPNAASDLVFPLYGAFGQRPNTSYSGALVAINDDASNPNRVVIAQAIRRENPGDTQDFDSGERRMEWAVNVQNTVVVQLMILRGVRNSGPGAFQLAQDMGASFATNAASRLAVTTTPAAVPTVSPNTVPAPTTAFSWGNTNDGTLSAAAPANWNNVDAGTWNITTGIGTVARQTFLEFRNVSATGNISVAARSIVPFTNARIVLTPIAA